MAGLLLNYSSGFLQSPIEKQDVIVQFLRIVEVMLKTEQDEINQQNLLLAVGNIIHKFTAVKNMCHFVKPYLSLNPISRDLNRLLS